MFVFFGLVAVAGTAYLQALRLDAAVPRGGDPAGCADHRDPRRQQPARHPHRHGRRQADARGRARRARGPRASSALLLGRVVLRAGDAVPRLARGLDADGRPGDPLTPFVAAAAAHAADRRRPLLRTVRGFGEPPGAQPRAQGDRPALAGLLAAVRPGPRAQRASCRAVARDLVRPGVHRVRVPFRVPFQTAAGTWTARESWLLAVRGRGRAAGLGRGGARGRRPTARCSTALFDELVATGLAPSTGTRGPGRDRRARLFAARSTARAST